MREIYLALAIATAMAAHEVQLLYFVYRLLFLLYDDINTKEEPKILHCFRVCTDADI